jgi:hypothetical protein
LVVLGEVQEGEEKLLGEIKIFFQKGFGEKKNK